VFSNWATILYGVCIRVKRSSVALCTWHVLYGKIICENQMVGKKVEVTLLNGQKHKSKNSLLDHIEHEVS